MRVCVGAAAATPVGAAAATTKKIYPTKYGQNLSPRKHTSVPEKRSRAEILRSSACFFIFFILVRNNRLKGENQRQAACPDPPRPLLLSTPCLFLRAPGRLLPLGLALESPPLSLGAAVIDLPLGLLERARVPAGREVLLEHQLVELGGIFGHLLLTYSGGEGGGRWCDMVHGGTESGHSLLPPRVRHTDGGSYVW